MKAALLIVLALFAGLVPNVHGQPLRPRLHVLAVGVNTDNAGKEADHYADDAEAIAYLFQKADPATYQPAGAPTVLRRLDATRSNVGNRLQLLQGSAGDDDVTLVFFSTHGSNADNTDLSLSLADGELPGTDLLGQLAAIPGRKIVVIDACRAGAIVQNWTPQQHGSISLLLAAQSNEDSSGGDPAPPLRHGFFVNALREGLLGLADEQQHHGNGDHVVSLPELASYAAQRASEIYPRQTAVVHPDVLPNLKLVSFDDDDRRAAEESRQHTFFYWKNPWQEPDLDHQNGYLVRTLAALSTFPAPEVDENAAPWPAMTLPGSMPECLKGNNWSGRWKREGCQSWAEGAVEIDVIEDTMFVRFTDETEAYLLEVEFFGTAELGGRYHNVRRTKDDRGRWVGRFVNYDRIDGIYVGIGGDRGRWDFRRKFAHR